SVCEVVGPLGDAAPDREPGLEVVPGSPGALEVEHVYRHTGRLEKLCLALDEERRARAAVGDRPLARDHQDPDRGVVRRHRLPAVSMSSVRAPDRAECGGRGASRRPARASATSGSRQIRPALAQSPAAIRAASWRGYSLVLTRSTGNRYAPVRNRARPHPRRLSRSLTAADRRGRPKTSRWMCSTELRY